MIENLNDISIEEVFFIWVTLSLFLTIIFSFIGYRERIENLIACSLACGSLSSAIIVSTFLLTYKALTVFNLGAIKFLARF